MGLRKSRRIGNFDQFMRRVEAPLEQRLDPRPDRVPRRLEDPQVDRSSRRLFETGEFVTVHDEYRRLIRGAPQRIGHDKLLVIRRDTHSDLRRSTTQRGDFGSQIGHDLSFELAWQAGLLQTSGSRDVDFAWHAVTFKYTRGWRQFPVSKPDRFQTTDLTNCTNGNSGPVRQPVSPEFALSFYPDSFDSRHPWFSFLFEGATHLKWAVRRCTATISRLRFIL